MNINGQQVIGKHCLASLIIKRESIKFSRLNKESENYKDKHPKYHTKPILMTRNTKREPTG